jgi:ATP-binding cassette, subfamily C, bacterial LapB
MIEPKAILPIQTALATISASIGNKSQAHTIAHGLPLQNGVITIAQIVEASERAGVSLQATSLIDVKPHHAPLLLCDNKNRAVVIARTDGTRCAGVAADGNPFETTMAKLVEAGFSRLWSARPNAVHDERTSYAKSGKRHWIIQELWFSHPVIRSVLIATVLTNILALAVPLITMNVMDRVVSQSTFETLWTLAIGGAIAISFDMLMRTLRSSLIDRASAASDVIVNNRIFSKVLGARVNTNKSSVGVQSNTLREFDSLREMSNSATVAAFGDLPFTLLFLGVIAMVAGWLVLVPIAMIPVLFAVGYFCQNRLNELVTLHYRDMAHKNAVAVEVLSNIETIKSHSGESWAATKWEKTVASYLRHSIAMRWWTSFSSNTINFLQGLTTIALLVAGVYLISGGSMSSGALFAATMLTGRALTPISQLAVLITKFHHARTAFHSLRHMVDVEQERPENARLLHAPDQFATLQFDRVSLSYSKDTEPALRGVNLKINAGERIGIIGSIGSGKTTMLRAMMGLRLPSSGTIMINGIPIHQIDPADYRRLIGCAFREEGFFYGTIRENLAFHAPGISDEDLIRAAQQGGALPWINKMTRGFDSVIGEGGAGLSSGQKQTLALSRAFIGKPPLILLDEPTSDLDAKAEAEFVQRLMRLNPSSTMVAVTHRPAVIEACTRLIVMDAGVIMLDGDKHIVLQQLRGAVQQERNHQAA